MIPKPFLSISISRSIDNINSEKFEKYLSPFCQIEVYENDFTSNPDIVISENINHTCKSCLFVLVNFETNFVEETDNLRVFQPFINESPKEIADCTDQLIDYVKALISIYNMPVLTKSTTVELE